MRKERCGDESSLCSGSVSKESACNVGDPGSIPGSGRSPGGGHGNPLQYSCLENPYGQRSLEGCSPQGCKESDMTERLTFVLVCSGSGGVGGFKKPLCQAKSGCSIPERSPAPSPSTHALMAQALSKEQPLAPSLHGSLPTPPHPKQNRKNPFPPPGTARLLTCLLWP